MKDEIQEVGKTIICTSDKARGFHSCPYHESCVGSVCMVWRWHVISENPNLSMGRCGLAPKEG